METKKESAENAKKQPNKEKGKAGGLKKGAKKEPQTNKSEVKRKEHKDTKFGINNQIIKHQSVFKKGKIFATRKLVQKIKTPKKSAKQNEAAKTERFESVLNAIKQMSARRLAALALANHKSTKNALADVESTPEQLAVGYFANQDFVQKALESIYQTMNLDGGTTFWKKQVRKLFKKKGDKAKGTATGKGGATKEQDESATDDQESSDEDGEGSDEGDGQSDGESDARNEDNEKVEKPPKNRPAKKPKLEKAKPARKEENEIPKPAKSKKNKKAAESTVDDFFITAEGTSYLSTAVVKEEPKVKKDAAEARSKPQHEKRNKPFDKVAQNNRGNGKFEAKPSFKRHYEEVAEPKKEIDPNLHPSWLAKQKQKPIIAGFQGKKITFD